MRKNTMEFTCVQEIFNTLSCLKHKYRILGKHLKILNSMSNEDDQDKEVGVMRAFLLTNPDIQSRVFKDNCYKCKRDNIYMDCVENHCSEEVKNKFWEKLQEAEMIFFPSGRPKKEDAADPTDLLESEEARRLVGSDPLLADVMRQIVRSGAITPGSEPVDIASIMQNEKFMALASGISGSLTSGKYTKDNLEKTIDTISEIVGDDVDPELKQMIGFLKKSVKDVKAGKTPDIRALIDMVGKLNIGGAGPMDLSVMAKMFGK